MGRRDDEGLKRGRGGCVFAAMDLNQNIDRKFCDIHWINGILIGLLGVLILSIVILSCVPPVSKDALVHHLAVPRLFLKHGGLYEIPSMDFSYYPMNLDLLYMIPLFLGQDIIAKFVHFSFALLTALIIFLYLKDRLNITYGILGVVLFLSIPIIVKLSMTVYVDLGVIFFSTASILFLFRWMKNKFRVGPLVLSAVSCGLAMGTKYNGLITFLLTAFLVPFIYARYSIKGQNGLFRALGYATLFSLLALTVFSPWMIRNYRWKGNPIYPLYQSWFNSQKASSNQITAPKVKELQMDRGFFTYRKVIYKEKWWEMALLPIRIFFQGKDGDPQFLDGKLNPFLLIFPFFAFFRNREGPEQVGREKMILFAFALFFFLFAFFSRDLRIRYVSPMIPPLVLLSIFGVKNLQGTVSRFKSKTVRLFGVSAIILSVIFMMTINADYIRYQFLETQPFQYITGKLSRDEYISKHRREYPAIQYINNHLPEDALILFVFLGKRGYYCDRSYIVSGESKIRRLVQQAATPEEILMAFRRQGLTHLLIYDPIFTKWINGNFDEKRKNMIKELFIKYIKTLYHENGFSVSIINYPLA